jgi:hypothetical protein
MVELQSSVCSEAIPADSQNTMIIPEIGNWDLVWRRRVDRWS